MKIKLTPQGNKGLKALSEAINKLKEDDKMTPAELKKALEGYAKEDLACAKKRGSCGVSQTKEGLVDIKYNKGDDTYTITTAKHTKPETFKLNKAIEKMVGLYDVVFEESKRIKESNQLKEELPHVWKGNLMLSILKNPVGTYMFVGKVPAELSYVKTDGSVPSEDEFKQIKSSSNPAMVMKSLGVKTKTYKSSEEALADAKKFGFKVSQTSQDKQDNLNKAMVDIDKQFGKKQDQPVDDAPKANIALVPKKAASNPAMFKNPENFTLNDLTGFGVQRLVGKKVKLNPIFGFENGDTYVMKVVNGMPVLYSLDQQGVRFYVAPVQLFGKKPTKGNTVSLAVLMIPKDVKQMQANLKAPIEIALSDMSGGQVMTSGNLKEPAFDKIYSPATQESKIQEQEPKKIDVKIFSRLANRLVGFKGLKVNPNIQSMLDKLDNKTFDKYGVIAISSSQQGSALSYKLLKQNSDKVGAIHVFNTSDLNKPVDVIIAKSEPDEMSVFEADATSGMGNETIKGTPVDKLIGGQGDQLRKHGVDMLLIDTVATIIGEVNKRKNLLVKTPKVAFFIALKDNGWLIRDANWKNKPSSDDKAFYRNNKEVADAISGRLTGKLWGFQGDDGDKKNSPFINNISYKTVQPSDVSASMESEKITTQEATLNEPDERDKLMELLYHEANHEVVPKINAAITKWVKAWAAKNGLNMNDKIIFPDFPAILVQNLPDQLLHEIFYTIAPQKSPIKNAWMRAGKNKSDSTKQPKEGKGIIGKVMWISDRDGNGVIINDGDPKTANEFYFDSSTAKDIFSQLKRGDKVTFDGVRLKPDNILTARNIKKV